MRRLLFTLFLLLPFTAASAAWPSFEGDWMIDSDRELGLCGGLSIFNQNPDNGGVAFDAQIVWQTDGGLVARLAVGAVNSAGEVTINDIPIGDNSEIPFLTYHDPSLQSGTSFRGELGELQGEPVEGRWQAIKLEEGQGFSCY